MIIQLNLAVFELPEILNPPFYSVLIMQPYGLWQGLIGGAIDVFVIHQLYHNSVILGTDLTENILGKNNKLVCIQGLRLTLKIGINIEAVICFYFSPACVKSRNHDKPTSFVIKLSHNSRSRRETEPAETAGILTPPKGGKKVIASTDLCGTNVGLSDGHP